MPEQTRIVQPGPDAGSVRTPQGEILRPPPEWLLLPPGDAALTRRVKAAGPTWTVQEKRGRKLFSRGLWAPRVTIEALRTQLAEERAQPSYAKKRVAATRRREQQQGEYVATFRQAVLEFLAFAPLYCELAEQVAEAVTVYATPVGSGAVARTARLPVERRAETAVVAWMRHQTTAYESMVIPRVKGKRREVRRRLAQQSKALLAAYRRGRPVEPGSCPLQKALRPVG